MQVAALETLVKVASSPEAGLLGSSWVIILRCLSLLEALQVRLITPSCMRVFCDVFCHLLTCSLDTACSYKVGCGAAP